MHILNHFVTAQCFLLLLFYPDAERVIWIRSGNSELAYILVQYVIDFGFLTLATEQFCIFVMHDRLRKRDCV